MSDMRTVDTAMISAECVEPPASGSQAITFETKNAALKVTILKKLMAFDLGTCYETKQAPIILQLASQTVQQLSDFGGNYFLVRFSESNRKQEGVLYKIRSNYYGIREYDTRKQTPGGTRDELCGIDSLANYKSMLANSLLPRPQLVESSNFADLQKQFSMNPSKFVLNPIIPPTNSPQHIDDPLLYLRSRYYTILYSNSTPLSYFPKTAISRMKVLSHKANDKIREVLEAVILPTEVLDARHYGKAGILHLLHSETAPQLDQEFEVATQTEFISKQENIKEESDVAKEIVSRLTLRLKIREAQMQLILIFELLCAKDIEESKFLAQTTQEEKPKKQRPSLVRRRKQSKKIIPTFLGMGVASTDFEEKSSSKQLDDFNTLQTINNLVERMNIWDTLYDQKSEGLMTYVAYVLVPYFNRKLPLTIKHIVEKLKSASFKLKPTSSRKSISRSKSSSVSLADIKKRTASVSASFDTVTSIEADTFGPPISLKRSKSNLSSKNLHKRQVDLSQPIANKQQEEESQESFIFAKAKRIQSAQNIKPPDASKSQVTATPVKPKANSTQLFVAQTPIRRYKTSEAPNRQEIFSPEVKTVSCVDKTVKPAPEIFETPLPVFSSPVVSTNRRKPGEPVTFAHSPFFNALNGSPTANYVVTTVDEDDHGIFSRASTKRKRQ